MTRMSYAEKLRRRRLEKLSEFVEREAAWNGGVGNEWEGWALLEAAFLSNLVTLAAHAPAREIEEFLKMENEV